VKICVATYSFLASRKDQGTFWGTARVVFPLIFSPKKDTRGKISCLLKLSNSKRLAKMNWLAKFWKKSQKHSSNRLATYPTSYPN
jgi:hypothetical protein